MMMQKICRAAVNVRTQEAIEVLAVCWLFGRVLSLMIKRRAERRGGRGRYALRPGDRGARVAAQYASRDVEFAKVAPARRNAA